MRFAAILLGFLMMGVALGWDHIRSDAFGSPGFGRNQILLLAAGIFVSVLGLSFKRFRSAFLSLSPSVQKVSLVSMGLLVGVGVTVLSRYTLKTFEKRTEAKKSLFGTNDGYQTLQERIKTNHRFFPRVQYSLWLEKGTRSEVQASSKTASQLAKISKQAWREKLEKFNESERGRIGIEEKDLQIPFGVRDLERTKVSFRGTGYEVESFNWQVAPGIYKTANIYRPLGTSVAKLPVILSPLGCGEKLNSHREDTSVQRRLANFALAGFLAFSTTGFCWNDLENDEANRYSYFALARIAGSRKTVGTLEALTWLRAIRMLSGRSDTDMGRVGITGYSNGASISRAVGRLTRKIHAMALVAVAIRSGESSERFSDNRDRTVLDKPFHYFYGGNWRSPFDLGEDPRKIVQRAEPRESRIARAYGLPRKLKFVLGAQDGLYSVGDSTKATDLLNRASSHLGFGRTASLEVVDGKHHFNAERRQIVNQWMREVFQPKGLLVLEENEFETPLLSQAQLEKSSLLPPNLRKNLHQYFSEIGLDLIAQSPREKIDESSLSKALGIQRLAKPEQRPILLDETYVNLGEASNRFEYWLLPFMKGLNTVLISLQAQKTAQKKDRLLVWTEDALPTKEDLMQRLKSDRLWILHLPGFGPTAHSQMTTGNFSVKLSHSYSARDNGSVPSLAGLGVQAVKAALNFIVGNYPGSEVTAESDGVDAGVVLTFATALFPGIRKTFIKDGLNKWEDLYLSKEKPVPSPTLLIPGIFSRFSLQSVRDLRPEGVFEVRGLNSFGDFGPPM